MSLVFRNSRRLRRNSRKRRCAMPAMVRSGMARRAGTVSRSWRGGKSRKKRGGAYRATRRTSTAAILKRRSTACSSGVSTFPMAIRHPGRSRLQAALVRAPDILRGNTAQARCARRAGWRLQRQRWLDDALFRPEVRRAFHTLTQQGWTDALRALHPGEQIFTFWDYFRNAYARNAGLRIDHLLASPTIAKRLIGADVDRGVRGWERASDHAPTWIELKADSKPAKRGSRSRKQ
jgi:endonuclease/exonuclease/phosphatase family protein